MDDPEQRGRMSSVSGDIVMWTAMALMFLAVGSMFL
jgi:hypothetical protein